MLEQNENIVLRSKQCDAPLCLILRERESTLKHLRFSLSVSLSVCVCKGDYFRGLSYNK